MIIIDLIIIKFISQLFQQTIGKFGNSLAASPKQPVIPASSKPLRMISGLDFR